MTASENNDTADESSTDKPPAFGSPRLTIEQELFSIAVRDEESVGRAEIDTEIWWGSRSDEPRVYLHGQGELAAGGEYTFGAVMNYRQAKRVRDLLEDAIEDLEV